MNILIYDLFGSFQIKDVEYCLKKLGHNVCSKFYLVKDRYNDDEFSALLQSDLDQNSFDLVFTTNYYPIVSSVCYKNSHLHFCYSKK